MNYTHVIQPLTNPQNTVANLLEEHVCQSKSAGQTTPGSDTMRERESATDEIGAELLRRFAELEQRAKTAEEVLERARQAVRDLSEANIRGDIFNLT